MAKHMQQRTSSTRRPALPLFLYDLSAATQLLPPAAVLPEQFYGHTTNTDNNRSEVALMRAVLEDAVNCFQRVPNQHTLREQREAEQWLFSNDVCWPFSFVNICAVLGLNADYIRLGLKRWQQNPLARPIRKRRREAVGRRPAQLAA